MQRSCGVSDNVLTDENYAEHRGTEVDESTKELLEKEVSEPWYRDSSPRRHYPKWERVRDETVPSRWSERERGGRIDIERKE